jgi:hypothetical protein
MEDQFRYLHILGDLLGDEPARKVILVTTKGNMLPEGRAMAVENELLANDCYWRRMKQLGSRLIRHTGDKESAMRILNSVIQVTAIDSVEHILDRLVLEYTTVSDDLSI